MDEYYKSIAAFNPDEVKKYGFGSENAEKTIDIYSSPWFRYFLAYDPANALEGVKCPVLALNGTLDKQVDYKENLTVMSNSLVKSGNRDFKTIAMPGLNHLFQKANKGFVYEYGIIKETINPAALKTIGDWLTEHERPAR